MMELFYENITARNSAWKVSVFGFILVCIFPHSDWIQSISPWKIFRFNIRFWIKIVKCLCQSECKFSSFNFTTNLPNIDLHIKSENINVRFVLSVVKFSANFRVNLTRFWFWDHFCQILISKFKIWNLNFKQYVTYFS